MNNNTLYPFKIESAIQLLDERVRSIEKTYQEERDHFIEYLKISKLLSGRNIFINLLFWKNSTNTITHIENEKTRLLKIADNGDLYEIAREKSYNYQILKQFGLYTERKNRHLPPILKSINNLKFCRENGEMTIFISEEDLNGIRGE